MGFGILCTNGKKGDSMYKVFESTSRSLSQFTNFVNRIFSNNDEKLISFCRMEYGHDWQWAYTTFKRQGSFPNDHKKSA